MEETKKNKVAIPDMCKIKDYLKDNSQNSTLEYTIEIVTPMFGGGVKAGMVDENMPVRATEIRGHLRFWWRMLYRASYPDSKALFDAESQLWGNTQKPSSVDVVVTYDKKNKSRRNLDNYYGFEKCGSELYALYPAIQNKSPTLLREGYEFNLEFRFKNDLSEIDQNAIIDALQAWVLFGGLGARTRKGCGTLSFKHNEKSEKQINNLALYGLKKDELRVWLSRLDSKGFHSSPTQDGPKFPQSAHVCAWSRAVTVYKNFRQKEGFARSSSQGRSCWPEADSLRKLTGCSLPRHCTPLIDTSILPAFPRAVMGLPIIFHFAHAPGKEARAINREPKNCTATPLLDNGSNPERMASPIITKPLLIDGQWYPFILVLPHQHALGIGVEVDEEGFSDDRKYDNENVVGRRLTSISPMQGKENAIESFITYLGKNNFTFLKTAEKKKEVSHD